MPSLEPAEGPATHLHRFEEFHEGVRRASDILEALQPSDVLRFILQSLEQAWREEVQIQKDFKRFSSLGLPAPERTRLFLEKYGDLFQRIVRDCLLLAVLKRRTADQTRESGAGDEIDQAIQFVTTWLSAIQQPKPWPDEVLRAHESAGFSDRLAARLDLVRGTGADAG